VSLVEIVLSRIFFHTVCCTALGGTPPLRVRSCGGAILRQPEEVMMESNC